jgi:hypothetical protein
MVPPNPGSCSSLHPGGLELDRSRRFRNSGVHLPVKTELEYRRRDRRRAADRLQHHFAQRRHRVSRHGTPHEHWTLIDDERPRQAPGPGSALPVGGIATMTLVGYETLVVGGIRLAMAIALAAYLVPPTVRPVWIHRRRTQGSERECEQKQSHQDAHGLTLLHPAVLPNSSTARRRCSGESTAMASAKACSRVIIR